MRSIGWASHPVLSLFVVADGRLTTADRRACHRPDEGRNACKIA